VIINTAAVLENSTTDTTRENAFCARQKSEQFWLILSEFGCRGKPQKLSQWQHATAPLKVS